jgi:predicted Zn-dependent protease
MTPQQLVERAIDRSAADGCVVLVEDADQANLRWANNTATTNGVSRRRRVTVVSIVDDRAGVLTRAGVDGDSVDDLVRASEAAARAAEPAEDARPLVRPDDDGCTAGPPVGGDAGWKDEPATTSIGVFADVAPALGEAFAAAGAAGHLLFGYAEHRVTTTYLGTSTGVRRRHAQPTGSLSLNAKSAGFDRSAYVTVPSVDFRDVDLGALGADLARRLDWSRRQVGLPAGRYETILPPGAVADLWTYGYWLGWSGRDAAEGRSVFSRPGGGTRLGERLSGAAPVRLTMRSDPGAPGVACAPFVITHSSGGADSLFDNGLPLGPTDWIADGTLTTLMTSRHTAGLTGLPVAPPVDNLVVSASTGGSDRSVAEMVAGTARGLLLNTLWYVNMVDPRTLLCTGLTRDGVYLVENGEVTGVVNNFRFNESPVELLHRVTEAGRTERCLGREFGEHFNRTAMPALRVPDFNMSSVSAAS